MVTLEDMKAHLNVTFADDDALITSKLAAATGWIARYTGTVLDSVNDTDAAVINEAIRQLTAHLYENREATLSGITAQQLPLGFLDLLSPYRAFAF